ncbi:MAG: ankyrin repeat domain-containing protein, partial [Janthinobacterium lividum]
CAELCLNERASINHRNHTGMTALMIAARYGRISLFNLLLSNGADWQLRDLGGRTAQDHALSAENQSSNKMFIAEQLACLPELQRARSVAQ